jgi:WD40 repeat protein
MSGEDIKNMSLFFSPDNKYLASEDNTNHILRIWEIATGKMITRIEHEDPITIVSFSPDDQHIATGDLNGNVSIWDYTSGELRAEISEHSKRKHGKGITGLAYSNDGKLLAYSSNAEGVSIWDATTQEVKQHWSTHYGVNPFITFSPDDSLVAIHAYRSTPSKWSEDIKNIEGPITLRSTNNGQILATLAGVGHLIEFSSDSLTVYTGGSDGTIRIWDISSGHEKYRLNLKTIDNWLLTAGVLGAIWFFFWAKTIRRDGFLLSLQIPLQALALSIILTLLLWLLFSVFMGLFSGFPGG